ncbi:hypothetical protein QLQ12_21455 [Actinoplanes sp. NEAU-A12]|uniref:Halobacterial output domain-containing protein n=1 Tax=Actinoplanes sandaracinus TaxID=3045177 RepID=A0ABT6WNB4_9ACTN|nr:hypothetical protein [Actinoplanes sandaracinus]MDI6101185.1 hypothetical protein [Actinoplanes sandaracinus]
MTATPDDAPEVGVYQASLDGRRLSEALRALGPIEPALTDVLTHLNLRIYRRDHAAGDRTDYVVLDVHGVSIGVQRREGDLYLHADTSETNDAVIAFEINGGGEIDHPTH